MIVDNLFSVINRGKSGGNIGISTDMPRFDRFTYGIQRNNINVITGDTGISVPPFLIMENPLNCWEIVKI